MIKLTEELCIADEKDRIEAIELLIESELPVSDLDENKKLYVLKKYNRIIGTGGLEFFNACALLRSISVQKNERGKGLGQLITSRLENIAKGRGVDCLYLLTTTAIHFFIKEGYNPVDRNEVPEAIQKSSEFESICPSTAVVMKKALK